MRAGAEGGGDPPRDPDPHRACRFRLSTGAAVCLTIASGATSTVVGRAGNVNPGPTPSAADLPAGDEGRSRRDPLLRFSDMWPSDRATRRPRLGCWLGSGLLLSGSLPFELSACDLIRLVENHAVVAGPGEHYFVIREVLRVLLRQTVDEFSILGLAFLPRRSCAAQRSAFPSLLLRNAARRLPCLECSGSCSCGDPRRAIAAGRRGCHR